MDQRESDRPSLAIAPMVDPALAAAIEDGAIALRFQPQVDPRRRKLVGLEALSRWPLEPDSERLFRRAEAAGLGERLSRHVQERAIRAASQWLGPLADVRLSLNCVAADLLRPSYGPWLIAVCARHRVEPSRLTLEITESSLVTDRMEAAARLAWLREWGIRIALDDFGTGYANLSYLTSLPLDALKIDRELVCGLVRGERNRIVVRATMTMARALGLKIVVEGVETEEQLALVRKWGCDAVQGFLVSPPIAEKDLARLVAPLIAA